MENLRTTRSVNITSNNILEGLLPIPENHIIFEEDAPQITRNNEATTSANVDMIGHSEASTSTSSSTNITSIIGDNSPSIHSRLSVDTADEESK